MDLDADENVASEHQSDIESDNSESEIRKLKLKAKEKKKQLSRERSDQKYKLRKKAEEEERYVIFCTINICSVRRLASKPKKFVLHELASGETTAKFLEEVASEIGEEVGILLHMR